MEEKIELCVVALSESESHPEHFALILEDLNQQRRIPIVIGVSEAQAIAIAMEKMQPLRPLTHDLMKNTLDALGVVLKEVLISHIEDGMFIAHLNLQQTDGTCIVVDARSSDAIALAIRCSAPIYSYDLIIEEAGLLSSSILGRQRKGSLAEYSLEELEELLRRVVEKEDYKSAARIQNYIAQRRG